MEPGRARNIRDIAHLYLSMPAAGGRAIVVAGADRGCFPGFHVANLAAALARMRRRVRIVEQSGLVVNAARFLALPPQVYAAAVGSSASAIDGVEVRFGPAPDGTVPGRTLDLVHAPPLDEPGAFHRVMERWKGAGVALFARRAQLPVGCPLARLILIASPGAGPAPNDGAVAGVVTRWERTLADALPACVRDPGSRLARAYAECAGRLISASPTEEFYVHRIAGDSSTERRATAR